VILGHVATAEIKRTVDAGVAVFKTGKTSIIQQGGTRGGLPKPSHDQIKVSLESLTGRSSGYQQLGELVMAKWNPKSPIEFGHVANIKECSSFRLSVQANATYGQVMDIGIADINIEDLSSFAGGTRWIQIRRPRSKRLVGFLQIDAQLHNLTEECFASV